MLLTGARPGELLALVMHHEKIEVWFLEQAGMVFETKAAPGALRVVNNKSGCCASRNVTRYNTA
jgi:hypothetical protein